MSNQINENLLERAKEAQQYWVGTIWDAIIQQMIDSNDLDGLREVLAKSDYEIFQREYSPDDAFPVDKVTPTSLDKEGVY